MSLSSELISQFAKITQSEEKSNKESTAYGTIRVRNGKKYVQLDGSELLTPISTTTDTKDEERVTVTIKNHTAIVTGNISSPSARSGDVNALGSKVTQFDILIANKVDTEQLNAESARIDTLISENVTITQKLSVNEADILVLEADNVAIRETLTANKAQIDDLEANKIDATFIVGNYATVEDLAAVNAIIYNLDATYVTVDKFDAVDAVVKNLDATYAEIDFSNIDFSNIDKAVMWEFYANSGIIQNVQIGEATITGELVGVTIRGDLIEGGTVKADKLVIKGENGMFYKLNTDGITVDAEEEQTDKNSLSGSVITAKSITADKISVTDLSALGAKISDFTLNKTSIYSGVKSSVDNTTEGIYLDKDGQIAFGDSSEFIKFYIDEEGNRKLEMSASRISMGSDNASIDIGNAVINIGKCIESLVTDSNGSSLMTQTADGGWTFSMANTQSALDELSGSLDELQKKTGDADETVKVLTETVADLGKTAEYIRITTHEGEPCIELGESDSDFKLLITNTRILFMEGSNTPAYITNQSLHIEKAVVERELQQGGFVWTVHGAGNLGLQWKGVSE